MEEFADKFKRIVKENFNQSDQTYYAFESKYSFFCEITSRLINLILESGFVDSSFTDSPISILDVGCGTGNSTSKICQLFPNANVCGIDLSPKMIETARNSFSGISFLTGDGENLLSYFSPNTFDLIIYTASIFMMPDQEKSLSQARELLKPNGVVAVSALMQLQELHDTPLASLPSFRGIIKNEQLPSLFENLFSSSNVSSVKVPLPLDVAHTLYSIPAISAAPFPNRPLEERLQCVDTLINEVKDRQLQLAQDWLLLVGHK